MKQTHIILLSTLLLFLSIPTINATEDLNIQWVWESKLYQQIDTNLIIHITNNNISPISLKTILIHYPWDPENSFNILYLTDSIQPTKTLDIKFPVHVPNFTKTGETSDFACILDYSINNSTEVIGTGIVRTIETIYPGKSIYVSQTIDPSTILIIIVFFIIICIILYYNKETLFPWLYNHKSNLPLLLFIVTFSIYTASLYMNYVPYLSNYSDFQGFHITGDEPHYVFATNGLLQGTTDPIQFYPENYARHIIISEGLLTKGQVVFAHMYGLSAMSMIPYKLGEIFLRSGVGGCLIFISLLVSLIIQLIYKTSMFLSNNNIIPSLLTSLAFAFSTLLFVWSGQFFTEIIASFFIMLFITLIITSDNPGGWFLGGISLSILPFLKFQFITLTIPTAILTIYLLKNRKPEQRAFTFSYTTLTLAILLFMFLFVGFKAYGSNIGIMPQDIGVKTLNIFGIYINKLFYLTWIGLLLDRNVGILFFSPILILSLLGVFPLLKIKNIATYIATLICILWVGSVSLTTFWNGWIAPPGRYMIVLLPLFSLPFIMGLTSFYKHKYYMISFTSLFLLGLIPNLLMATNRLLDYVMSSGYGGGVTRFMEALQKLKINIAIFPEFFDTMWSGQNISVTYIWSICFIIISCYLLYLSHQQTNQQ